MISDEKRKEIDEEFAKILGADFVMKVNKLPDERTWCCWVLSECEILKAMADVGTRVSMHPITPESFGFAVSDDNRELFIKEVVDKFKDALSIMAEEWEAELRGCVSDVFEDWQDIEE